MFARRVLLLVAAIVSAADGLGLRLGSGSGSGLGLRVGLAGYRNPSASPFVCSRQAKVAATDSSSGPPCRPFTHRAYPTHQVRQTHGSQLISSSAISGRARARARAPVPVPAPVPFPWWCQRLGVCHEDVEEDEHTCETKIRGPAPSVSIPDNYRELVAVFSVIALLGAAPVNAALNADASDAIRTSDIVAQALNRAVGGGVAGAMAAVVQVLTLMWLRTCMNYQYRYGTSLTDTFLRLYKEGGIPRFYQGLPLALLQGPLSRFGDTAANAGVLAIFSAYHLDESVPLVVRTAMCSIAAGTWRIALTPLDVAKTSLQVQGRIGWSELATKFSKEGVGVLFSGALATCGATIVGHYPWFLTFNFLNDGLPTAATLSSSVPFENWNVLVVELCRNAFIGLCASCTSDCISNSLRVLKTTKQTSQVTISYQEALKSILEEDGWLGLFGRGLQTRLLVNCLQGILFTVAWKYFEKVITSRT